MVALRRAQEAMARATQLVEAVERLAAGLDDAAARLPAELDAAARDVAAARDAVARLAQVPAVPPSAPGTATAVDPAGALRAAEAALGEARRAAEARPLDPLAALQRAVAANQAADAIVAQVADANAQVARRRQVADAAIATAHGHVSRAIDYITTRRHGVGETARTRAAEAEMRLEEARGLAAANPEGATATANRAIQLADEAYRLAAGEFEGWNRGGGPVAGPYRPQGADARDHRCGRGWHPRRPAQRGRARRGARQRLGWQPVGRRRRWIARAASACRAGAAAADAPAAAGSACRRGVAGSEAVAEVAASAEGAGRAHAIWRARRISRQGRESIDWT